MVVYSTSDLQCISRHTGDGSRRGSAHSALRSHLLTNCGLFTLSKHCTLFVLDKAVLQLEGNPVLNCAQIWSTETALLLCTCRGHRAEVTDLAVNVDNTLFASSSNDHTVRCWSLEVSTTLMYWLATHL